LFSAAARSGRNAAVLAELLQQRELSDTQRVVEWHDLVVSQQQLAWRAIERGCPLRPWPQLADRRVVSWRPQLGVVQMMKLRERLPKPRVLEQPADLSLLGSHGEFDPQRFDHLRQLDLGCWVGHTWMLHRHRLGPSLFSTESSSLERAGLHSNR
jgi:hypothetical protein